MPENFLALPVSRLERVFKPGHKSKISQDKESRLCQVVPMRKGSSTGDLLQRLLKGVEFIESHVDESLPLSRIARHAALSEYHFHRLFRACFGIPVIEYVRGRRLSSAARRLVGEETPVLDLSLDSGFESPEAFARAFRKMYGISPTAYRRRGKHLPWRSVAKLTDEVLQRLKKGTSMEPLTLHKERIWAAGLSAVFTAETRSGIPGLWKTFLSHIEKIPGRIGGHTFGICDAASGAEEGTFEYLAAVQVDPKKVTGPWKLKEIPAGDYLVFTHRGPISKFTQTADYLWGTWLPNSGQLLRKAPDLELYDTRFSGEDPGSEVDLWIPVGFEKGDESSTS